MKTLLRACLFAIACILAGSPAVAAPCGGDFETWLASFRREAAQQGVFRQSFEQFSGHRIAERLARAQRMMLVHASMLQRIEARFGVPGSIVIAIWGLETDFG